ncbi:hypothetical protein [Arthrobacter sp. Hiyo1]|nr:hypothetical protein [Arthrobacter sp. Hiyo1]
MRHAPAIQEERTSGIKAHTLPAGAGQKIVVPSRAGVLCEV